MCDPDLNDIVATAFVCQRCGGHGMTTLEINHKEDCPVFLRMRQRKICQSIRDIMGAYNWGMHMSSFSLDDVAERIATHLIEKKLVK